LVKQSLLWREAKPTLPFENSGGPAEPDGFLQTEEAASSRPMRFTT
jgi:hypothetical protein